VGREGDHEMIEGDKLIYFVESYEQREAEKKAISENMKDLLAEVKGAGYDRQAFLAVIAMRKKDPDDVAEHEALVELYRNALEQA
jgi:uncharacterized protein (UPF0335 family)